jgi:hypothetical protein
MTWKLTAFYTAAVVFGTGLIWHEHSRAAAFQQQIEALRDQEPSPESEAALAHERDDARAKLQRVAAEAADLKAGRADLLKLRGEVTTLRRETRGDNRLGPADVAGSEPVAGGVPPATLATLASNVASIKQALQNSPAQQVPELCLLEEQDWIKAARDAKMGTEQEALKTLSRARTLAKERLIPMMSIKITWGGQTGRNSTD